jgi:hypothetical protein
VDSEAIRTGAFRNWAPASELRRLKKLYRSARFYRLIHHPTKPKLIGNNVGIHRADFEKVNGYDENFEGWGCEDDDLRGRLRQAGVHVESIVHWTHTFHLWHASDTTAPTTWKQGANVRYLLRKGRLTRCTNGLEKRTIDDLGVRIVGIPAQPETVERLVRGHFRPLSTEPPEMEILFLPGDGRFSGRAECNVLVALDHRAASSPAARRAHRIVMPTPGDAPPPSAPLDWDQFSQALRAAA